MVEKKTRQLVKKIGRTRAIALVLIFSTRCLVFFSTIHSNTDQIFLTLSFHLFIKEYIYRDLRAIHIPLFSVFHFSTVCGVFQQKLMSFVHTPPLTIQNTTDYCAELSHLFSQGTTAPNGRHGSPSSSSSSSTVCSVATFGGKVAAWLLFDVRGA